MGTVCSSCLERDKHEAELVVITGFDDGVTGFHRVSVLTPSAYTLPTPSSRPSPRPWRLRLYSTSSEEHSPAESAGGSGAGGPRRTLRFHPNRNGPYEQAEREGGHHGDNSDWREGRASTVEYRPFVHDWRWPHHENDWENYNRERQ